jgi:uracil-DNA glycosylase family 4
VERRHPLAHCELCPLSRERTRPVPARPARSLPVLAFVCEKPTRTAANNGTHASGPGWDLAEQSLRAGGVSPADVHLTSAILCPADTDREARAAVKCCAPRLHAELAALPQSAPIIASGREPLMALLGFAALQLARGFIWQAPVLEPEPVRKRKREPTAKEALKAATYAGRVSLSGREILPTLSHAYAVTADTWAPLFRLDVKRAAQFARGETRLEDGGFHAVGGLEALDHITGAEVSCDIETSGVELTSDILCVGVSDGEHTGVIWPWLDAYGPRFAAWMRPRKAVVFHNAGFDVTMLDAKGTPFDGVRVDDTLLAHHAFASHWPQKLDQLVSEVCVSRPWKVTYGRRGRRESELMPWNMPADMLTAYNAADCRLTARVWQRIQPALEKERAVYELDRGLSEVCRKMKSAGIAVDLTRRDEIRGACETRKVGLLETMQRVTGRPDFAPGKKAALHEFVFRTCGAKPLKFGDGGAPSVDETLLQAYRKAPTALGEFCTALLEWRAVDKVVSTYLRPTVDRIDRETGRMHYDWKPFGTVSGRLAGRLQSCPRWEPKDKEGRDTPEGRVRELYVPAPGHAFVYYDVSQAEMRIAAYLSADPAFIAVCAGDVHAGNARNVFPEVAAKGLLDKEAIKDPLRGKPYRDVCKNLGFAIAYGAGEERVYLTLVSKGFPITLRAVQTILGNLRRSYRKYYSWAESNVARVQSCGYMRSPFLGRIRWFGWHPPVAEVYNYPIQSGLADVVNDRTLILDKRAPPGVRLVAQIHDATIYETPLARVDEWRATIADVWAQPIATPGGPMVLPIDLKVGERWSDL